MSWLYSQALVVEYLGADCSDGEPFVQLNVMPTQQQFWRKDKMMECSNLSQFGQTLRLLTDDLGEELLTLFLAGFHAKTSVQQVEAKALVGSGQDYGQKCGALLGKYDQDSHSLKIAQCSLFEDSMSSYATLPRWGMMQDGELWEQPTWERLIEGIESGSWPTPQASDNRDRGSMSDPAIQRRIEKGKQVSLSMAVKETKQPGSLNPTWVEWLMGWPLAWTDSKPLEMDKFHQWRQQHSLD